MIKFVSQKEPVRFCGCIDGGGGTTHSIYIYKQLLALSCHQQKKTLN